MKTIDEIPPTPPAAETLDALRIILERIASTVRYIRSVTKWFLYIYTVTTLLNSNTPSKKFYFIKSFLSQFHRKNNLLPIADIYRRRTTFYFHHSSLHELNQRLPELDGWIFIGNNWNWHKSQWTIIFIHVAQRWLFTRRMFQIPWFGDKKRSYCVWQLLVA